MSDKLWLVVMAGWQLWSKSSTSWSLSNIKPCCFSQSGRSES